MGRLIYDLTYAQYDAIDAVRWSNIKHLADSPLAYRRALQHNGADTPAMRFGRAVHTAVLEPQNFSRDVSVYDGAVRRGKDWEAFVAADGITRDILKRDEFDKVQTVAKAVRRNAEARRLLRNGRSEVTVIWRDSTTGIRCKARIDHLGRHSFEDLKTTATLDERVFAALSYRMGYFQQLAWYGAGLAACGLVRTPHLIVVESDDPHDCDVMSVNDDDLYMAERHIRTLLDILAACRKVRRYPGRHTEIVELKAPAYAWGGPSDEELLEA